jgi:hypothetical protein
METTVKKYEKHPFNIFPGMSPAEHDEVKFDIEINGYDSNYPIMLYKNKVLDGWNRQQICEELGVEPVYEDFPGDDSGALDLIFRSNKRRNLTSSQWAAIAVEAQPIYLAIREAVKNEKAEKLQGNQNAKKKPMVESIPPSELPKKERDESRRSKAKIAKTFNTNPKYIDKAEKLTPELREQLKNNVVTMADIMRAERTEAMKAAEEEKKAKKTLDSQKEIVSIRVEESQVDVVIELTDAETLELIRIARSEIQKLASSLPRIGSEANLQDETLLQKIEEIQLNLGKKLTGY